MRKKHILFFSLILCFIFVTPALAYRLYGYDLIGGVEDRQFTVPSNANYTYAGKTINYATTIRNAVASWNNAVDSTSFEYTNIHFTETTNYGISQLDFYVYDYGNVGWRGKAEFFDTSNNEINPGGLPTKDWKYGKAKLNVYYLHSLTDSARQQTTAHEMGHILGLHHADKINTLMYYDHRYMTTTPTSDDVDGIRAIY